MNRISVAMFAAGALWSVTSVLSMTYGTLLNLPEFVHTDYGLPLTFATHTSSTIAGPVNSWSVDLGALMGDLVFWVLGMMVILTLTIFLQGRSTTQSQNKV